MMMLITQGGGEEEADVMDYKTKSNWSALSPPKINPLSVVDLFKYYVILLSFW